jgi:hypothetical protein
MTEQDAAQIILVRSLEEIDRRHFRRRASPKPSLRLEAICGRRRGF